MDQRPKYKARHYETLKGQCKQNTLQHPLQQYIFDSPARVMRKKKKDRIKLKTFCTAKKTTDKTKRQPTEWEEIFGNYMTDNDLISQYVYRPCNSMYKK